MKIKTYILVSLPLLLMSCSSLSKQAELEQSFAIGTSKSDVVSRHQSNDSFFQYINYAFLTVDGYDVTIHFASENDSVDKVQVTAYSVPSEKGFSDVQEGMELFSVVNLVGNPFASETSGLCSLDFRTSGDGYIVIVLYQENSYLYVSDVIN